MRRRAARRTAPSPAARGGCGPAPPRAAPWFRRASCAAAAPVGSGWGGSASDPQVQGQASSCGHGGAFSVGGRTSRRWHLGAEGSLRGGGRDARLGGAPSGAERLPRWGRGAWRWGQRAGGGEDGGRGRGGAESDGAGWCGGRRGRGSGGACSVSCLPCCGVAHHTSATLSPAVAFAATLGGRGAVAAVAGRARDGEPGGGDGDGCCICWRCAPPILEKRIEGGSCTSAV